MSSEYLILQRQCAHYREPLFQRLFAQQGWQLVCARNFLQNSGGKTANVQPFMWPLKYIFPRRQDAYLCHPPLFKILRRQPRVLVAEAGTKMTSTYLLALYGRLWPWRKTRIVFWGHGAPVAFAKKAWKRKLVAAVKRMLIQSVDGYLCYTQADKTYLKNIGITKPVFVANNTIDIEPALNRRDLAKYKENKAPHLLAAGRQVADKNFDMLIRVFQVFKQDFPEAQLTLVGSGPAHEDLKALAGTDLGQSIHMPGAVYAEDELAAYFNQADVYVTCGAVGLGANHAIAYGVPVLCFAQTEAGPYHHPEICYIQDGKTGWQVTPFSAEAMQAKLKALFSTSHSPRAQLADTLPDYAAQHLAIDNMVQAFTDIREKLT